MVTAIMIAIVIKMFAFIYSGIIPMVRRRCPQRRETQVFNPLLTLVGKLTMCPSLAGSGRENDSKHIGTLSIQFQNDRSPFKFHLSQHDPDVMRIWLL